MAARAPSGTHDVLWPESTRWEALLAAFTSLVERAGYGLAHTPTFEDVRVFRRGIGEGSDVVGKEMYEFEDRGGRTLALRPEGTAPIVRAFVQHRPPLPWKAWYATPAFRYERPQAGRYRQFYQAGSEAIGFADPASDAESIAMLVTALRELGLKDLVVDINSVGDAETRAVYRERLLEFLNGWTGSMSAESRARMGTNPLRVLDSKDKDDQELVAFAPKVTNHLSTHSSAHFAAVLRHLDRLGIPYEVNKKLVRGLDYYTDTVFEVLSNDLGAQSAVAGGGRYDGLVGEFQAQGRPAVGWGIGLDRLTWLLEQRQLMAGTSGSDVAVITLGQVCFGRGLALAQALREAGLRACFDASGLRSMKNQFKQADTEGCRLALVLGEDELSRGEAAIKDMKTGEQSAIRLEHALDEIQRRLGAA